MSQEELIYKLFGELQEKTINENYEIIKEHLSKQTNEFEIDVRDIDIQDLAMKIKNPNYLQDEYLKITESGIKILLSTKTIVANLKKIIPRTVKRLTIPSEFLEDLSFLTEFPNLETLTISDYSKLTEEEIKFIKENTKITMIKLRSSTTFNALKEKMGFNIIEAGNIIGQYKKLILYYKSYLGKWNSTINITAATYEQKNLDILAQMFEGITPYLDKISSVNIKRGNSFEDDIRLEISENAVERMSIKNTSPKDCARIYKMLKSLTDIKQTIFNTENATQEDFYYLKQLNQTSSLTIRYSDKLKNSTDASYQEFLNMRATIDYYKDFLNQSTLSPVEKVAYVYDILKTMRYQENFQDKLRARSIHAIVTDGTIVCAGYAAFAKELLDEVGIKCLKVSVTCLDENNKKTGHARNFVRIDDDKYNIHGLYAMDITWDSDKDISVVKEDEKQIVVANPSEELQEKVIDKYDSLALYRHFLIPMSTYEERYPNEINPSLYEEYKNNNGKSLIEESKKIAAGEILKSQAKNIYALDQHQYLFNSEEGPLTVERYITAKKPSLETFEQILKNVRLHEGYTDNEATKDIKRVIELHEMLNEQTPNNPNHFFKTSIK